MHPPVFVDVVVDAHDGLEGTVMRWRTIPEAIPRTITRVRYEPERGPAGDWLVVAAFADGSRRPARAVEVEDSSAGTATLIWGGDHGLRLTLDNHEVAEQYLVLSPDSILD